MSKFLIFLISIHFLNVESFCKDKKITIVIHNAYKKKAISKKHRLKKRSLKKKYKKTKNAQNLSFINEYKNRLTEKLNKDENIHMNYNESYTGAVFEFDNRFIKDENYVMKILNTASDDDEKLELYEYLKELDVITHPHKFFLLGNLMLQEIALDEFDEDDFDEFLERNALSDPTCKNLKYVYANYYFEKGASLNYPPCLNALADSYLNGQGFMKNELKAIELYKKASDLGYGPSQFNLGVMYKKNTLFQNLEKSKFYLKQAFKNPSNLDMRPSILKEMM